MAMHITMPTTQPATTPATLEEASSPLVICALFVPSGNMPSEMTDIEVVAITEVILGDVTLLPDTSEVTSKGVTAVDAAMMDNDVTRVDVILVDTTGITLVDTAVAVTTDENVDGTKILSHVVIKAS